MSTRIVFAIALLFTTPSFAQTASTGTSIDANAEAIVVAKGDTLEFKPDNRLKITGPQSSGLGASNASIAETSRDDLPSFIRQQADLIAEDCTGDKQFSSLIKFYRYASDGTREKGLSVDYILDLKGLKDKKQRSCFLGRACAENGECYLIGYRSYGYSQWEKDFMIRSKEWGQETAEDPKTGAPTLVFKVSSHDLCKSSDGGSADEDMDIPVDETCSVDHIWSDGGFIEYKLPNPDDARIEAEDDGFPLETSGNTFDINNEGIPSAAPLR
jgi:hypothetical protein